MNARIALTAALVVGGCASSPFERHLADQRWSDAVAAFEADSALHSSPAAVLAAAELLASPDRETWDPAAARTLLVRLYEEHQGSAQAAKALRYLLLIDEAQLVHQNAEARERELRIERDRLAAEVQRFRTELDAGRERMQELAEREGLLRVYVARLESTLRERDSQLSELRDELERLKAVDLRNAPRGGTVTPPRPD